jgi:hypothetical protein
MFKRKKRKRTVKDRIVPQGPHLSCHGVKMKINSEEELKKLRK